MTLENSRVSKFVLVCISLWLVWLGTSISLPSASPKPLDIPQLLVGFGIFMFGALGAWAAPKSKVRVDAEGIYQTNGFTQQKVRWAEVAAYYFLPGREGEPRPVLLSVTGAVLLRGYPLIMGNAESMLSKQKAINDFIESHLQGKKIESPFLKAAFWAPAGPYVDMSRQSLRWKIGYGLFWLSYLALWAILLERVSYYRFVVKTGPIAVWVNRLCLVLGTHPKFVPIFILCCFALPLYLLMCWQRWWVHRHILPFRFVTPASPPEPHPLS